MENGLDFTGKQILITGAAGGIGRETAMLLNRYGAKIILVDIDELKLDEMLRMLEGNENRYYRCDLSNVDSIEELMKVIIQQVGPMDGFVHCAGIGAVRPIHMSKYDFMLHVMNVNYFSYVEIIRCLIKRGAYRVGMNVVGVSAVGAFLGNATKTAYCSSKAAMNAATRCLAKELAIKSIRVNTVAPGVTDTSMAADFDQMGLESDETKAIIARQYLGMCKPIDIANSIAFLLSDLSKMITGTCISVDGGKLTS